MDKIQPNGDEQAMALARELAALSPRQTFEEVAVGEEPDQDEQSGMGLLVHGGAWDIPDSETEAHLDGLRRAIAQGRTMLLDNASSVDVVTEVVALMESHGAFDAGRGAVLTREGTVELDAGVMDGASLSFGSVACVKHIANPVHAARLLIDHGDGEVRILCGESVDRFAQAHGLRLVQNEVLRCTREQERFELLQHEAASFHTSQAFQAGQMPSPQGTIGCVALDQEGRLAAATSTGGTPFRPAGRIGDTPLPGAGFYANEWGAASATGWGEAIATMSLCVRAVDGVAAHVIPEKVARDRVREMFEAIQNKNGDGAAGGIILLDRFGRGGWAYTTPRMARGGWHDGGTAWAEV